MAYKFNPFTGKLEEYGPILTGTGTVAAAADGTVALPGISFANDLSVGIYRPGPEQLAISTNGTGRLFVDSSGNVGINRSVPQSGLDIRPGVTGTLNAITMGYGRTANPTDAIHKIRWASDDLIIEADSANTIASNIRFYNDGTEKMVLDSSGRLGLGTSSPSELLHVKASAGNYARIRLEGGFGGYGGLLDLRSETTGGGTDFAGQIRYFMGQDSQIAAIIGQRATNEYYGTLSFQTANLGSLATRLFISPSGNVGVGTTSPGYLLDVRRSSAGDVVAFTGSTDGGRPLKFVSADNGIFLGAQWTRDIGSGSGIHAWAINGTERARIDSSGRLLVGTSSARTNFGQIGGNTSALQVEGTTFGTSRITITRNSADGGRPDLTFAKSRSASVGGNTAVVSGDNLGQIAFVGSDGTNFPEAATIVAQVDNGADGTALTGSEMPGRLVFSTTADGASSPTERLRITSTGQVRLAGAGITFNGDTATANELDDYEEGTWTPTLNLSTTQYTSVSYNSWTKGYYRKIGSLVHVQGVLITNDIDATAGAGNVRIGGLPFASPANASGENYTGVSSISIGFADAWTTVQPSTAEVLTNSSLIALYAEDATGERTTLTTANVTDANFSNIIRFAGTYISV